MKKRTYGIIAAFVAVCAAVGVAFWLLSSGAPSYDKICRMNDDLKQARQLGLSTQEKCAERLGAAILKTTDETVLANLLANVSFEDRFSNAILGKIQSPEMLETVARTFKSELLADSSDNPFSESLYDAVLDRLPDDSAVERIAVARLAEMGGASDSRMGARGKKSSGKSELAACLCRRILAMDDAERAEALLEKMGDSDILSELPFETRLGIALRSKSEKVRNATGVDREYLELGDLVAKWDPNCLSRSVREIIARGREIKNAQEYIEVVKRFDPDFHSSDIDKWVEYAKSVTPLLETIEHLEKKSDANSSDSYRRNRLVEKRDKAKKDSEGWRNLIDEIKSKDGLEYAVAVSVACQQLGVYMDESDPYGTGMRLGNKLKSLYQEAKSEMEAADRELAAFDRAASSQRASTNGQISKLKSQLDQIRQRYETPETRKAREEREAAERDRLAANAKTISVSDQVSIGLQSVPSGLWFGKTEVTQAQWEAVMGENPSKFKNPDNPVEQVSWDDCQEFLEKLNELPSVKKSGLMFRLPTDEEWEFACRAGATGDYCKLANGTEITKDTLGQVAWFDDNSGLETHPVGEKKPNAFGLYDMHGNVWEWTSTAVGVTRVARGGGWDFSARFCGSSLRHWNSPSIRFNNLGFRLCASGKAD